MRTFSKAYGINADIVAGRFAVLAHTFQSQGILARFGPEVHEMEFPQVRLRTIQVNRLAQLDPIGICYRGQFVKA